MTISKEELRKMFGKEEYQVPFFEEMGFVRKKCKVCGRYFWTLDPNRETCGDVECEGVYRFIENRRWNPQWDIHATIKKWTEFFKKRGHEVLEPYPVVARWRDDIEFTIASIAVFQPWVVNGIVDPPANPLVIPQPCLRFGGEFSDIDNIGKTGRHLTSFTMGGQHAFNSKKFKAYWKDTYVRLNFEFHRDVLGIPEKEIIYKEDVWSGGGNFGPSLETFAYGLEIVNGVFMQYRFTKDGYEPLDLKVLDVGWGLERISWFMQRTPTIYEATFGPVLEWLLESIGLNVDYNLLVKYSRLSGMLDTGSPDKFRETRNRIAEMIGLKLEELDTLLGPIEAVYAILDHTKTLVFSVPDGGIPSNVGGYYNLRVIIRRALTLAEKYGFDIDWEELLHRQIDYFSKTFKRIEEGRKVVPEIWKEETKRYKKTLAKGTTEVLKLVKKKKDKVIGFNELKKLYINFGIPPETVEELGKKLGIKVETPSNFYDLIRLEKLPKSEEISEHAEGGETIDRLEKKLIDIPPTRKLYYEDRYMKEFEGQVLFTRDKFLVLNQTVFYPTGGGQQHDTGIIEYNGKTYRVINVFKVKQVIVHELDQDVSIPIGAKVKGKIDWERRYALMRHHTATHVINGAAMRVLGPHVWQVGADKTPERARLDISHFRNLTDDEVKEIERLANKIVFENRPVISEEMDRTSAEKKYGVRIYQGGAIPEKTLRIVNIKDWDVEACGGTHLNSTGEIGLIKITGVKKIHDGVVRLIFVAGDKALDYIDKEEKYLKEACEVLKVTPEDLPKTVDRFFKEWKEQQNVIKRLSNQIVDVIQFIAEKNTISQDGSKHTIFRVDIPTEFLINSLRQLKGKYDSVAIVSLYMGNLIVVVSTEKTEEVLSKLKSDGFKCNRMKIGLLCTKPKGDPAKAEKLIKETLLES